MTEWLDLVPHSKIMAFGGDYMLVEGTYGESRIMGRIVAEVLSEKVEEGVWKLSTAMRVARRILRDNAMRIFKI